MESDYAASAKAGSGIDQSGIASRGSRIIKVRIDCINNLESQMLNLCHDCPSAVPPAATIQSWLASDRFTQHHFEVSAAGHTRERCKSSSFGVFCSSQRSV